MSQLAWYYGDFKNHHKVEMVQWPLKLVAYWNKLWDGCLISSMGYWNIVVNNWILNQSQNLNNWLVSLSSFFFFSKTNSGSEALFCQGHLCKFKCILLVVQVPCTKSNSGYHTFFLFLVWVWLICDHGWYISLYWWNKDWAIEWR